jgi:pimeloyl-ACP methyl ester carboxylesterase
MKLLGWSRRRVVAIAVILAVCGLVGAAGWRVVSRRYPLELAEYKGRYELWREDIHEVQLGPLHGYVRDECGRESPKQSCNCTVFIHGLADNALTWKKLLSVPRNGWSAPMKLYAVDLPGSGKSPPPADPGQYRIRRQAELLHTVLAPECQSWIVVGNSMGGWIAAWLALDWPAGVRRLMLVDSAGLKPDTAQAHGLFSRPTVESMKDFQRKAYRYPRELPDYVWAEVVERMKASNSRQIEAAFDPDDYLDGKLGLIHRPTLLLWGLADGITPVTQGKRMHEAIPSSAWREVKDCGHLPQKECPLNVVNALRELVDAGGM